MYVFAFHACTPTPPPAQMRPLDCWTAHKLVPRSPIACRGTSIRSWKRFWWNIMMIATPSPRKSLAGPPKLLNLTARYQPGPGPEMVGRVRSSNLEEGKVPVKGQRGATPRYIPRAGERLFKTTLAGTDAKAKDNEQLVQKPGIVNGEKN